MGKKTTRKQMQKKERKAAAKEEKVAAAATEINAGSSTSTTQPALATGAAISNCSPMHAETNALLVRLEEKLGRLRSLTLDDKTGQASDQSRVEVERLGKLSKPVWEAHVAAVFTLLSLECSERHLAGQDPASDKNLVEQLELIKSLLAQ
ncbi:unnamed protein product [Amoebophrya sp. A120]|nr:unnamed protein product [Amoebophrya sp. A120]|eukprot:GSA120T00013080001.1